MKRLITVLGATAAGFTSVVALHGASGSPGSRLIANPSSVATTPPTTVATSKLSSKSTTTTTTTPTGNGGVSASAIGATENYGYGTMSVKVTVAQNRIVGLSVNSLHTLDSYSQQLEGYAVPVLKAEVLKAQGIRINALTGATYTSEAYAYSIQSALDKLHFK